MSIKYEMPADILRKIQLTMLSMMKDVDDFCKKHSITYYLAAGSCLGAARHQGFIPWDDDMDISMPYADYARFLELTKNGGMGDKYFVQTFETEKNFHRAFAKIRLNGTTLMEGNHRKYEIHQGVWIDVFPIVQINPGIELKVKKIWLTISNYMQAENYVRANYEEFQQKFGGIGIRLLMLFYKIPEDRRISFHRWMLKFIYTTKSKSRNCEIAANIFFTMTKDVFEGETQMLSFEDTYFAVHPNWDLYLKEHYGDYMILPPEERRQNHGDLIVDFERDYSYYRLH